MLDYQLLLYGSTIYLICNGLEPHSAKDKECPERVRVKAAQKKYNQQLEMASLANIGMRVCILWRYVL